MANDTVHDGASSWFETIEFNEWLREKAQREQMQAAEVEYLEGAEDQVEFRRRREQVIVDDTSPLDEVEFRSYCARRAEGEGKK